LNQIPTLTWRKWLCALCIKPLCMNPLIWGIDFAITHIQWFSFLACIVIETFLISMQSKQNCRAWIWPLVNIGLLPLSQKKCRGRSKTQLEWSSWKLNHEQCPNIWGEGEVDKEMSNDFCKGTWEIERLYTHF